MGKGEFIHPFTDGNGRIGRFWQYLILFKSHPLFEFIPIESVIKKHQRQYYNALEKSDKNGDSTFFIEFSLETILEALTDFFNQLKPETQNTGGRLRLAQEHFGKKFFKRKDYILFFKTISTATASRDLQAGVKQKIIKSSGKKALTQYLFIKK
jgi:Fic family protein